MTAQVDGVFPTAIREVLLEIAHQLDRDAVDLQCAKVGADALGGGECHLPRHRRCEAAFDLVGSRFVRLDIDIMGSERQALKGKTQAACHDPVDAACRKFVVELAQNSAERWLDHVFFSIVLLPLPIGRPQAIRPATRKGKTPSLYVLSRMLLASQSKASACACPIRS